MRISKKFTTNRSNWSVNIVVVNQGHPFNKLFQLSVGGGHAQVPRCCRAGGRRATHEENHVGPVLVVSPALL